MERGRDLLTLMPASTICQPSTTCQPGLHATLLPRPAWPNCHLLTPYQPGPHGFSSALSPLEHCLPINTTSLSVFTPLQLYTIINTVPSSTLLRNGIASSSKSPLISIPLSPLLTHYKSPLNQNTAQHTFVISTAPLTTMSPQKHNLIISISPSSALPPHQHCPLISIPFSPFH